MSPEIVLFYTLAVALLAGKALEELVARAKMPPVLGDLLAGLIIGASFLNIFVVDDVVKAISWFGVSILLFYAGLSTSYREFMSLLPIAGLLTLGEALAAFSMGFLVGFLTGYDLTGSFFLGAILEATSVSITVRALVEIGRLNSLEGNAIMEIAVLDDLSSLITIAVGTSIVALGALNVVQVTETFLLALGAWAALVYILHRVAPFLRRIVDRMTIEESYLAALIIAFAGAGYLVSLAGVSPLVGAYASGLALSEAFGLREARRLVRGLAVVFSTIFFVSTAAELDIWSAAKPDLVWFYTLMVVAAFIGKLMGAGATSYLLGFPARSALRIAVGLFPRCEFAIIAAYTAVASHVLGYEAYLAALIVVLVTNLATPPLLKIVFSGEQVDRVRLRLIHKEIRSYETPGHG